MDVERIVEEIRKVRINLASIHQDELDHLSRLFFVEIMTNGWYGMDEVEKVLKKLSYEEHTKKIIREIAETICCLRDPPQTVGRNPDGYKELMSKILN